MHKAGRHNNAPATIPCGLGDCAFMAKAKHIVSQHRSWCHNNTTRKIRIYKFQSCGQPGCEFQTKYISSMKNHLANIHNIDKKTHVCGEGGCIYETTSVANLKTHKQFIHGIDTIYYYCDDNSGCLYKCKSKPNLTKHKSIHVVNGVYFLCEEDGCEYKSKFNSNFNRHKANIHKSKVEVRNDSAI